ncbi:hypothetical protein N7532_002857 [Penicillium argentinense]|uniref:Uncharacterized protein n=1 Tax=Penicillium argentinense TaxID=1131581 RepID=A0A9W9G2R5_9EURO|nr:uncharacterized protein N7532_002857 [Penicillium argentinense]KAJ5110212.1 hypothetical protein N7532_002857 [Penicillium argentinense]
MRNLKSYFNKPAFAQVLDTSRTPVKEPSREVEERAEVSSSPLADPPPSSNQPVSTTAPEIPNGPGEQLNASLSEAASQYVPEDPIENESFLSAESAAPPSSLGTSLASSQRIVKGGKEIVISSDGEETDAFDDLDDPSTLFAPKPKPEPKKEPVETKPVRVDKAYLARLTAPKKYKNSIDSLVHDALDENEVDAHVARVKASFVQSNAEDASNQAAARPALNEDVLTSALGDTNDEEGGPGVRRLLDAVRRTEALDQERVWRFFNQTPATPIAPDFPRDLFQPESNLAPLREPETRARMIQSGILEFVSSLGRLPNEFLKWLFLSIPCEPREELRRAYCRILTNVPLESIQSQIGSGDIDDLFRRLGARPQALALSSVIVAERTYQSTQDSHIKYRGILLSIFSLFQDASERFSVEVRTHALHLLLRMSLDNSVTADYVLSSRLQSAITALLENVAEAEIDHLERQLSTSLYETVKDTQFQSCMVEHILPTSPWVSALRYRLAMAFLLQSPKPLTESVEDVLNLERITLLLRERRFQISLYNGNEDGYDYEDLIHLTLLLEVVLNKALLDMRYKPADRKTEFNVAIDQIATQLKTNFGSMKESGATHLKRMLAKGALEILHYRLVFSVRSKPPPRRTAFENLGKDHKNKSIRQYLQRQPPVQKGETDEGDETQIPIRKHQDNPAT